MVTSFVFIVGAGVVGWANWRYGQLRRYHVHLARADNGEPENFLVTGSDSRAGIKKGSPNAGAFINGQYDAGQRSDSIMVLRIDPKHKSASMLSIPRDLYVTYADGHGRGKINAAFSISPQVLTDTISQTFGISIHHFVQVDFVGFQKLVDAVGGVPIYFDTPMRDRNTGLNIRRPGCVKLHGSQALAFARSRHLQYQTPSGQWLNDNANDYGRIKRQQFLLRHAIHEIRSEGYVADPRELDHLASAFVDTVRVDQGFGLGTLKDLADRFKSFDPSHLKTYTLPAERWYPAPDGSDALKIDEPEAQSILNHFRSKPETKAGETTTSVEVLNGSGQSGQAANVAGALQQVGFRVVGTGNASMLGLARVRSHTQVRYAPSDAARADLVARHLAVSPQMVADPNVSAGQVELVTGTDFTMVEARPKPPAPAAAASDTVAPGPGASNGSANGGSNPSSGAGATGAQAASVPSSSSTTTSTTVFGRVPPDTAPPGRRCG